MIIHHDAFLDWCGGKTQREISKRYGVRPDTIRAWSSKENWREEKNKREEDQARRKSAKLEKRKESLEDTIYSKYIEKAEEAITYLLDHVRIGLRVIAEEQINFFNGKEEVRDLARQEKISKVGKILADSLRVAIPQVSDEIAETMAKELQDVNRAYENEATEEEDIGTKAS